MSFLEQRIYSSTMLNWSTNWCTLRLSNDSMHKIVKLNETLASFCLFQDSPRPIRKQQQEILTRRWQQNIVTLKKENKH